MNDTLGFLDYVIDNVNNGLILLNDRMEIISWNAAMQSLTGKKKSETIGKTIGNVIPDFDRKYYKRMLSLVLSEGQQMFLSSALHKDFMGGKTDLNITISRISSGDDCYIVIEFIDVTSQNLRISQLRGCAKKLSILNRNLIQREKSIAHMAYHDRLTGIGNRELFYKVAEKLLSTCAREKQLLGIMFIDVDKFKHINDTYGHEFGDRVLVRVAEILKESIRKGDMAARFGGDEFLLLLNNIKSALNYKIITSRILSSEKQLIPYKDQIIRISMSIGVSCYPTDGTTIDELIRKADMAMYSAKKSRENVCCFCGI